MKQLIAGVILIFAVGVGAFLYRNVIERPGMPANETACTMEAKVCPDGTSVGRSGLSCAFAPCALPNVEVAGKQVAFAIPAGYVADENAYGADSSLIAAFTKSASSGSHSIIVRSYPIVAGQDADTVILENTRYQPSDMQATDFSRFGNMIVNGKTFRSTVIERFEGQIHSAYYLVRANDVLKFEITEHDVLGWTDSNLVVEDLSEHKALLTMLGTLQVGQ